MEPRARLDLAALRAAVALRGKGGAHAQQSERRDPHFARAHSASPAERDVHAERPAFHDRALRHPGHRPGQAPAGDPRPGEAAPRLHARGARALPDGVAHDLRRVRGQQRADVFQGTDPGERAGAARPRVLRRMDRCSAFHPARGDRNRSQGEVAHRRRCRFARLEPQRPAHQGPGRCHDRAIPERRAAYARQRLSDAPFAPGLGRQYERQIPAPVETRRAACHELLRSCRK